MGLLAKRFGVTPRRPRGFMTDSLNATFLFPFNYNALLSYSLTRHNNKGKQITIYNLEEYLIVYKMSVVNAITTQNLAWLGRGYPVK